MPGSSASFTPLNSLLAFVRRWPVTSQHQARRNAMVASTACTQRRCEREDVEDFLTKRYRPAKAKPTLKHSSAPDTRTVR